MELKDIKIGMYVRTKEGYIAKLIKYGFNVGIPGKSLLFDNSIRDIRGLNYEDDNFLFDNDLDRYIEKASNELIDLIEAGDYVNGVRVEYIDDLKGAIREFYYIFENPEHDVGHYEEEIKSIVTKEQFEQMKYVVK